MQTLELILNGNNFPTLEEFWDEAEIVFADFINEVGAFGKNFSALRDILSVASKDTVVIWKNSKVSAEKLGYSETKRQLEISLKNCHSSWIEILEMEIKLANFNRGETLFDNLVKIFVEEENIQLRLE